MRSMPCPTPPASRWSASRRSVWPPVGHSGDAKVALVLIEVTNHAAERFRQRVRGTLEEKAEIRHAVARALEAGLAQAGESGTLMLRDADRRDVIYLCRRRGAELLVITLWEDGEGAAVPKRFTDALRRDDHRVR
jgi:hypothetical protein